MLQYRFLLLVRTSILGSALLLIAGGCNARAPVREDRAPLKGTVLYQGNPLPAGSVFVVSATNKLATGTAIINQDGTFVVEQAPQGSVKIAIETEAMPFGDSSNYVPIPRKYADPNTSGLTAEVKLGELNGCELNLK